MSQSRPTMPATHSTLSSLGVMCKSLTCSSVTWYPTTLSSASKFRHWNRLLQMYRQSPAEHGDCCHVTPSQPTWWRQGCVLTWMYWEICLPTIWFHCTATLWPIFSTVTVQSSQCVAERDRWRRGSTPTVEQLGVARELQRGDTGDDYDGADVRTLIDRTGKPSWRRCTRCTRPRTSTIGRTRLPPVRATCGVRTVGWTSLAIS